MKKKVLVIDDDARVGTTFGRLLGRRYEVDCVTSAQQALVLLEDGEWDIIICDLHMPETSGIDLYEEIRKTWPGWEERVVFITGGLYTEESQDFVEQIDNPVVYKPFALDDLQDALDAVE